MSRLRLHPYSVPLVRPYRWAKGEDAVRCGLLVQWGKGPVAGWGEAAPPPHEATDPDALARQAGGLAAGLDLDAPRFLADLDARNPPPRLRCGLATAHLDAAARRMGIPLCRFLAEAAGLDREPAAEVPVNALVTADAPALAALQAREAVAAGFSCLKVKCGADRRGDVQRVAAVRAAAGPGVELRLDANEAWDAAWALEHLQELSSFSIAYVEQPLPAADLEASARLRAGSPIPVALDEAVAGVEAVAQIAEAGAADRIIVKPQRVGGPDRALAVVLAGEEAGLPATVTNSLETAVGRSAGLHVAALLDGGPACGLATGGLLGRDVAEGPAVHEGRMVVPRVPGSGVHPEVARLAG